MDPRPLQDALRSVRVFPHLVKSHAGNMASNAYQLIETFDDLLVYARDRRAEMDPQVQQVLREGAQLAREAVAHGHGHSISNFVAAMDAVATLVRFLQGHAFRAAAEALAETTDLGRTGRKVGADDPAGSRHSLKPGVWVMRSTDRRGAADLGALGAELTRWDKQHVRRLNASAKILAEALRSLREDALAYMRAQDDDPSRAFLVAGDLDQLWEIERLAKHLDQLVNLPSLFYQQVALLAQALAQPRWKLVFNRVVRALQGVG